MNSNLPSKKSVLEKIKSFDLIETKIRLLVDLSHQQKCFHVQREIVKVKGIIKNAFDGALKWAWTTKKRRVGGQKTTGVR